MPKCLFKQLYLTSNAVQPPDIRFRLDSGEIFNPLGYSEVRAQYNSRTSKEKLYLVKNQDRIWIHHLGISLLEPNKLNDIKSIESESGKLIQQIEQKFSLIFKQAMEILPNYTLKLQLQPETKPVFIKLRQLLYAILKTIKSELLKLVIDGIITKIDNCDLASLDHCTKARWFASTLRRL